MGHARNCLSITPEGMVNSPALAACSAAGGGERTSAGGEPLSEYTAISEETKESARFATGDETARVG